MQPQPVWKKRWSVGAKTPQMTMSACPCSGHERLVGVDRVEAADRLAVRLRVGAEDAVDHAAVGVEDHVHRAVEPAHRRDLVDVRAHRPGVGAVVRLRRGDERAVVGLDRLVRDDARQDQLAASSCAPVVRLGLADRDLDLGARDLVVQPDRRPARRDADERVRVRVPRVVLVRTPSRSSPSGRGSARPSFCSMSDSDIGKTFPLAQTTRTSVIPAASIASKTGGRSFEDGVGRNWLSMITATLVLPARSSANAGPSTGLASASRAASVASATGGGSSGTTCATRFARRDRRARACRGASSTRRRSRRSRAGPSTRTGLSMRVVSVMLPPLSRCLAEARSQLAAAVKRDPRSLCPNNRSSKICRLNPCLPVGRFAARDSPRMRVLGRRRCRTGDRRVNVLAERLGSVTAGRPLQVAARLAVIAGIGFALGWVLFFARSTNFGPLVSDPRNFILHAAQRRHVRGAAVHRRERVLPHLRPDARRQHGARVVLPARRLHRLRDPAVDDRPGLPDREQRREHVGVGRAAAGRVRDRRRPGAGRAAARSALEPGAGPAAGADHDRRLRDPRRPGDRAFPTSRRRGHAETRWQRGAAQLARLDVAIRRSAHRAGSSTRCSVS